jgi:hypothetical protein
MSDNKPHWVDYANLASNVAQNIQLSQLHSTLSALASLQAERALLEQNQQQATERENRLRESIWRLEIAFDTYLRNPGATPSGRFAVAKQMIAGLAQGGVTTSSFSQFVDKDRLGRFFYRLQQTTEEAGRIMSEREKRDAEAYLRYESEAQDLDALTKRATDKQNEIKFRLAQAKRRKETATSRLEELRLQLGTHTNKDQKPVRFWHKALAVVMIVAAIILAVIGGLAALLGILSIGVSVYYLFEGNSRDVGVFFGFGAALLAVPLVPLALMALIGSRLPKPKKSIPEQIAHAEKTVASADTEIAELKAERSLDYEFRKFNASSLSGLLKEQATRTDLRLQFRQEHNL